MIYAYDLPVFSKSRSLLSETLQCVLYCFAAVFVYFLSFLFLCVCVGGGEGWGRGEEDVLPYTRLIMGMCR